MSIETICVHRRHSAPGHRVWEFRWFVDNQIAFSYCMALYLLSQQYALWDSLKYQAVHKDFEPRCERVAKL